MKKEYLDRIYRIIKKYFHSFSLRCNAVETKKNIL